MFSVQLLMLAPMRSVEIPMISAVLFIEMAVETAVLSPGHRPLVCLSMLSVEIPVLTAVLGIQALMNRVMLSVQVLVDSAMLPFCLWTMSKGRRCSKQQAGKGENSKSSFLQMSAHRKNLLGFINTRVVQRSLPGLWRE
ncbi:MAG: hypothetical protein ACRERD_25545 [Candidatus Binatia bacterium]